MIQRSTHLHSPNKFSALDREKRNARIIELACDKGCQYSTREIAAIIRSEGWDIRHNTVSLIIKNSFTEYKQYSKEKTEALRDRMAFEIDMLIEELWHQYGKSAKPTETTIAYLENRNGSEGDTQSESDAQNVSVVQKIVKKHEKKPTHDIAILARIESLMDKKAKLFGLYAPNEVKAEVKHSGDIVGKISQMSDAELLALLQQHQEYLPTVSSENAES